MNHRALLLAVSLSLSLSLVPLAGCKKDPREVIHTEEIGSTGFVIDLPKDTRTSRYGDKADGRWDIKNGSYPDGYVILRTISSEDKVPEEEWAVSYCGGSRPVFKDAGKGGKSITCFRADSGTKYIIGKAWIPDGAGKLYDCEYKAFAESETDASALKLAGRVCASIRKK